MICLACKEDLHDACPGRLYCNCQHKQVAATEPRLWGRPVE